MSHLYKRRDNLGLSSRDTSHDELLEVHFNLFVATVNRCRGIYLKAPHHHFVKQV